MAHRQHGIAFVMSKRNESLSTTQLGFFIQGPLTTSNSRFIGKIQIKNKICFRKLSSVD